MKVRALSAALAAFALLTIGAASPVVAADEGVGATDVSATHSCVPLVVNLHGGLNDGPGHAALTGLASTTEFDVVNPTSLGGAWRNADVGPLRTLIGEYRSSCPASRVVAAGYSSGGAMAQHLLSLALVDAAVPVSGLGNWVAFATDTVPGWPISGRGVGDLVALHGRQDAASPLALARLSFFLWKIRLRGTGHTAQLIIGDHGHVWPSTANDVIRDVALDVL